MPRMSIEEAEARVVALLKQRGRMTSFEVDAHLKERDEECPESLVVFLARLRAQGKLKGEVSRERRAWVWWVE